MNTTVVVSQLGARMHYAVPRIFAADGMLQHFYTDICATRDWPRLLSPFPKSALPAPLRRLAGRKIPPEVPASAMTTFPSFGIKSAIRRFQVQNASQETSHALWAGARFSELVSESGFHGAAGLYAFSGDALEQIRAARKLGMWTAVEQMIAPRGVLEELLLQEMQSFPKWEGPPRRDPLDGQFAAREQAEWMLADRIICPSEFVARHVIASGIESSRCIIVPYGVDSTFRGNRKTSRLGALRVLTVGAVGLRKGSPYVLDAARRLRNVATFRMVGGAKISERARRDLDDVLELRGIVPRAAMATEYEWADVFLLPSLCEGSATAVYEALAAGLPVITTENTGSIVRHGVEGYIVPIRDGEAIASVLGHLAKDADLLLQMGANARARAAEFTVACYGRRLLDGLSSVSGIGEGRTT
jgi:glycosyltransferase involved in cell wall biosynthesis